MHYDDDASNSFLFYIVDFEYISDVMIYLTGYLYANTIRFTKIKEKEWIYKDEISFGLDEIEIVILNLDLSMLGKFFFILINLP